MKLFWEVFWSFCACLAFGVIFRLRGGKLFCAAFGAALGWLVFRLANRLPGSDIADYFLATIVISIYSEIMARLFRAPVSIYLAVALIPLVPGGGIYDTMEQCLIGNASEAARLGLHTIGIAGALAIGIVMVSSTVRILTHQRR